MIREPCTGCRGAGYVQRKVTRKVDIPAGVDDRTRLRLSGEGEPSPNGGPPGDCYCFIHVAEHSLFQRRGQTCLPGADPLFAGGVGARSKCRRLDGPSNLPIPGGTQNGEVFALQGRGMPDPRHRGRGDLLVQVHVDVPKTINPEHEANAAASGRNRERPRNARYRKSFFEKLKELFRP